MDNELIIQQEMISQIREIMINARQNVAVQVNNEQLLAYWDIGRVIVDEAVIPGSYKRIRERILSVQCLSYAAVLSELPKIPVTDWKIDMDTLLRIDVGI